MDKKQKVPVDIRKIFAGNLKGIRKSRNVSQAEMAKELSVPITTYAHYETGYAFPKIETILAISDFAGININSLLVTAFKKKK